MNLFDYYQNEYIAQNAPLASRIRPNNLDDYVGQQHLMGEDKILRNLILSGSISSMILWGPPGTGKTTLASLISHMSETEFKQLSATSAGVADFRKIIDEAKEMLLNGNRRTILFIDELHRWNKAQQDAVLPFVEDGTIIFIGATTENPSFEIIGPLLSRCRVFVLQPLSENDIETIIDRAFKNFQKETNDSSIQIDEDAKSMLVGVANGDARVALNGLELALSYIASNIDTTRIISLEIISEVLQYRSLRYDKNGEQHYDVISAFIKSVRGSNADAAIYWLARLIESGEDPEFIARRLVILAAEDVGLADPNAISIAVSCQQAVHFIGMPEGRIPLAEATIYLANAEKSNSAYIAINNAIEDVRKFGNQSVPLHLRNAPTELMESLGYGKEYKYAHDYSGHFVDQQYLPDALIDNQYYFPSSQGYEITINDQLKKRNDHISD